MAQTIPRQDGFEEFFRALRAARESALLLDYDGTLAPFRIDPGTALPYPGVCEQLNRIMRQGRTRVVLVTGRWIKDLLPLLDLDCMPEIWGSHGWEHLRPDGEYRTSTIREETLRPLLDADSWTGRIEAVGGRCEHKPAALAIHWRGLSPERVTVIRDIVREQWLWQRMDEHLVWHDFDGGIELRAPDTNKAHAVEAVLRELGVGTAVAYLGDDETDEDAFCALRGRGLGVLVRPAPRPSGADLWLQPPHELLQFLQQWHNAHEV